VEPRRERAAYSKRSRSPCENEERCLQGIFGLVRIAERLEARAEHHAPMALDQNGERELRDFALARREPFEKLRVREPPERTDAEEHLKIAQR
jgi:hypothetical protein